ncbi:hypothetical protein OIU84_029600 [Salix udensis]|uniref:Uncharacterized protein n=1 Tax=Salix udensis TaxID=889485 RepID=A0AAD6K9R2_9ROSI|nr:hypothetical protein OIU84_029600 [Salix udensis]
MASTPPESPSNSGKVKEAAVEASFGCILRLKNAVNDEFLQDLLRKVMNTVFFNGRFLEYYRTVMPYLNFVMIKASGESNCLLLSATISCMTTIWTVIGKDKFSDDTQQAWGRLCKCLGHKFPPYMEVANPCLLQSARLTLPDVANIEESDER